MVLGKEIIISNDAIQGLFERFFGERLLVQDLWYDQETKEVHMKIGKITKGHNISLEEQGFKEITNPSQYPSKENLDGKIAQMVQSAELMLREW